MALPTKLRTWTFPIINSRYAGSDANLAMQSYYLAIKNALKSVPGGGGVVVRGSSNGVAGAFDGTDRWAAASDIVSLVTNYSWIVLRFPTLGNAELCHAMFTSGLATAQWSFSPGGLFAGGSVSAKPTASDEITFAGLNDNGSSNDRLLNFGYTSDGLDFFWLLAYAGNWQRCIRLQAPSASALVAPATRTGPIAYTFVGRPASYNTPGTYYARMSNGQVGATFANINPVLLYETYNAGGGPPINALIASSDLQGMQPMIQPIGLFSTGAPRRGKVCNLDDVWMTVNTIADGNTYPIGGDREFIQVGSFMWPWNGAPGVPGTNPQLT